MFSKLILTVLAATSAVLAAPLEALDTRQSPNNNYFTPSATFQYSVRDGAIYPASWGYVGKYPQNQGYDYTTLLTFTYPEAARGKRCRFEFFVDGAVYAFGSRKLDLFTSNQPAPAEGASTWPPGNRRDVNLGRLSVPEAGGLATWGATYSSYLTAPTDCKAPGTREGLELVGVNDEDYVSFPPTAARIVYSS